MFQLEFKLRYLIQDEGTLGRVFAVYDCCRCRLENMPGLLETGRGVAENLADEVDSEEEEICKYFHIQACGPGGIADADGGFAEKIYEHSVKYSKRNPVGFVTFPTDWSKRNWNPGEICSKGGADY
jgi:hypothetical protein